MGWEKCLGRGGGNKNPVRKKKMGWTGQAEVKKRGVALARIRKMRLKDRVTNKSSKNWGSPQQENRWYLSYKRTVNWCGGCKRQKKPTIGTGENWLPMKANKELVPGVLVRLGTSNPLREHPVKKKKSDELQTA